MEGKRDSERLWVIFQAFAPLGNGKDVLEDAVLKDLAAKHGKTCAQVGYSVSKNAYLNSCFNFYDPIGLGIWNYLYDQGASSLYWGYPLRL